MWDITITNTGPSSLSITGMYRISWPIRHTVIFSLEILEKNYINFSNLLEENRIVTYQN